jgi:hypothetical protein
MKDLVAAIGTWTKTFQDGVAGILFEEEARKALPPRA